MRRGWESLEEALVGIAFSRVVVEGARSRWLDKNRVRIRIRIIFPARGNDVVVRKRRWWNVVGIWRAWPGSCRIWKVQDSGGRAGRCARPYGRRWVILRMDCSIIPPTRCFFSLVTHAMLHLSFLPLPVQRLLGRSI
jgi:hypothetical protein